MSDSEDYIKNPPRKGKASRPHGAVIMQNELLRDLKTNLYELETKINSEDVSKYWLKTQLKSVDTELENANKYHKIILTSSSITDEALRTYSEGKIFKQIKEVYWKHFEIITEQLVKFEVTKDSDTKPTHCSGDADVRLPRLELPTFSGNYEDWLPFYNLFISSVHNKSNLEPVQKLHYLMKAVTGDAYNQIKNLTLTSANYEKALDILKEQFDHKRKVAHTYMRKLLEYKSMSSENAKDLRDFISNIKDCKASLQILGLPVGEWDYILLYCLQSKIPSTTYLKWEEELGATSEIPKFDVFMTFLENRFRTLEMVEVPSKDIKKVQKSLHTKVNHKAGDNQKSKTNAGNSNQNDRSAKGGKSNRSYKCAICKANHSTSHCKKFLNNTAKVRNQLAVEHDLCLNCLGSSHSIETCYSTKTCTYCQQQHHSLLHIHDHDSSANSHNSRTASTAHFTTVVDANNGVLNPQAPPYSYPIHNAQNFYAANDCPGVKILGTALVKIINSSGFSITARALLDSGADDNYITSSVVNSAGLHRYSASASITGLNDVNVGSTEYKVNFKIQSMDGTFEYDSSASVVDNITSRLPACYIDPENFGFLNKLKLADPHFNHPGKVQLLLGVGFLVRVRKPGLQRFRNVIAENTSLGWVVLGDCSNDSPQSTSQSLFLTKTVNNRELSKQIQKFFEIEEFAENIPQKPEDQLCEEKFKKSLTRCADGKLMMELPFREESDQIIGPSKHIAMRRLLILEKKLDKNPELKYAYTKTFKDYLESGHLSPVTKPSKEGCEYFLPHHAVVKDSSSTTKVRVVFDGSCRSGDGTSLNDHLLTGPKLQKDIRDVFFKWRTYQYALTADITKMYRMFWIAEKHRDFQKVLWRFDRSEPVKEYTLNTVTFGTSSAPFQAIRALNHIAEVESVNFPLASNAILTDFYVDDFISGGFTLEEAIQKQIELRSMLSQYGLEIRKWSSNTSQALQNIPTELHETLTELCFDSEEFRKTLGIYWAPKGDFFSFSTSHLNTDQLKLTKRSILSLIARLYDPVGWVSPCTLHAKVLMQRIWEQGINWDEEVCDDIKQDFEKFFNDLPNLSNLKIPRWVKISSNTLPVTLFGFSDASLQAYGAVLYMRNPDPNDPQKFILLSSRTRVKPLKHVTLARLELCASVMLAELVAWAKSLLNGRDVKVYAFTDSKIVLSWLNAHPSRWKTYIAGRTTKVLETIRFEDWSYINTKFNPADVASRGALPSELIDNSLWWNGPPLDAIQHCDEPLVLDLEDQEIIVNETKAQKITLHTMSTKNSFEFVTKYSSHGKMVRVADYIITFLKNIFSSLIKKAQNKANRYELIIKRHLVCPEAIIIRCVQEYSFPHEITALQSNQPVPKRSSLRSLNPFIDGLGLLRVGGRLRQSYLSYNQKFPLILPPHHQVTTNLIHLAHHATLHGLNTETAAYLRHKFHIIRASDRIKTLLRCCPQCIRFARQAHEQLMGSLPKDRVTPHRAFLNTGVDFAGPFMLKAHAGRTNKVVKSYVALFVCFSTKAIHLELVSDLTAVAFLAAFKRFVSRRGRCQQLYSDCGTNFVKGNKLLASDIQKAQNSWKTDLDVDFQSLGTTWFFNPPAAPHFGGLWEAGVKSMKTHLNKTLGGTSLNPEEFNTVLVQIEGILNSRPLCPLKNDVDDFVALTPAHFLIGESIVAPPERAYDLGPKDPRDRWQFVQKLQQLFWVSWKKEYLHRLNTRPKWKCSGTQFKENDMVILADDNYHPTYWPLARIMKAHTGKDGVTRVVTIKTSKGQIFVRSIAKLRLLPHDSDEFHLEKNSSSLSTLTN